MVRKIFEPNIYLYDSYPGGVGLSEPLFRMSDSLLEKTHKLISECPCPTGCPSCVGPVGEIGEKGKEVALEILRRMLEVASDVVAILRAVHESVVSGNGATDH